MSRKQTTALAERTIGSEHKELAIANPMNVALMPRSFEEAIQLAKVMAEAGNAVSPAFRRNVGGCFSVIQKAAHWGFLPFDLITDAYIVNNGIVAYGGKTINAVINMTPHVLSDIEVTYDGDGPDLVCTVAAFVKSKNPENKQGVRRVYTSPKFKDIKVKNSPLWQSDPRTQFHYFSVRAWGRLWIPEVLIGAYTPEEIIYGGVTDADRIAAIEHSQGDVLDDDPISDDDEPSPAAPLGARLSYKLESCNNEDECKAVQLTFQPEIDLLKDEDRQDIRDLYAVHLKRVRGQIPVEEAMRFSRGFREV